MKVANGEEMRRIDYKGIHGYNIPGIVLMERAALCITEQILRYVNKIENPRVIIFVGRGNNGGDGLAIARQLYQKHIRTSIIILGNQEQLQGDARINLKSVIALGIPLKEINENDDVPMIQKEIEASDVIIDAIFGTGLSREIANPIDKVIETINDFGKYIIAVDIPSGIHANTGKVMGSAVKAHRTITFSLPKKGLYLFPGMEYSGDIIIEDIGIPEKAIKEEDLKCNILTLQEFYNWLPKRRRRTNKGTYGKIQLIAVSQRMTGAAILASKAAYRTGGGLVHLFIPISVQEIIQMQLVESITTPVPERNGIICRESIPYIENYMEQASVIAIGPGLGKNEEVFEVIEYILEKAKVPVIIDADGLNNIGGHTEILTKADIPVILTPHPGEMARLTGHSIEEILDSPLEMVRTYSKQWDVILVLKDARTIIGHPDGRIYINTTGNPGMATAGAGDVLTGIIAGFVGQKIEPYIAAAMGVFLHGKAGDLGTERLGEYGLIASDICNYVAEVLKHKDL